MEAIERFNEILDDIEKKIESHRAKALSLREDQLNYGNTLKTLLESSSELEKMSEVDRLEVAATIERLQARMDNVVITVNTSRNESQKQALQKINGQIEDLVLKVEENSPEAKDLAQLYLNSCSVGTGSKFEALLLSCTSDDQKAVKEKITTIVENIDALRDNDAE